MIIAEICVGLVLSLSAQTQTDEALLYKAPDGATSEDLTKAAQAFTERCKAYGYKGVQARGMEQNRTKMIQVTCETGFTPEMKNTLNAFAWMTGTSVELRFPYALGEVEREQYQAFPDPKKDRAPKDGKWFRFWNPETPPVLLRDVPMVKKGDLLKGRVRERSGEDRPFWEISTQKTREIREADRKASLGAPYLVLDGLAVEAINLVTLERDPDGQIVPAERLSFTPTLPVVRDALAYPLPFSLQPVPPLEAK